MATAVFNTLPEFYVALSEPELEEHIAGAKAVGAKAVLFAGDNARYVHNTRADYTFLSWRAFLDALPEIIEGN